MAIVYRKNKGSPLTIEELDGNFADLDARIRAFEEKMPKPEEFASIEQIGDVIKFRGNKGTPFGEALLPKFAFNPRGEWKEKTNYLQYDLVNKGNVIWCCIVAHQSMDFEKDNNENKWKIFLKI